MTTHEGPMQAGQLAQPWLRWPRLALALFCLILWLPGLFSVPPIDRDEARFAQASKQMIESGDYVDIRFGEEPRYKKPVGIYWLQATATQIAGGGHLNHIWTYRLPSLLGALSAALLAFWCARAFASIETAFWAALFFAASLLLAVEATLATTDAVLTAAILVFQGFLFRLHQSARSALAPPGRAMAAAAWAALGLAILVKGPVAPAVAGLTALAVSLWDRDAKWLKPARPLMGLAIAAVIVAPWLIAIAVKSEGAFFQKSLGHDFLAKVASGQESHGAPPGYYFLLSGATFWPTTLFLLPGLLATFRRRAEPAMRFLLGWAIPTWLMFELVPTKLPHYILSTYPALAMMAAVVLAEGATRAERDRLSRWLWTLAGLEYGLALVGFAVAALVVPLFYGDGFPYLLVLPVALFVAAGVLALAAWRGGRFRRSAGFAVLSAFILYPTLTLGLVPALDRLWVSPRLAESVGTASTPNAPPPAAVGFTEPSLRFLLGTGTLLSNADDAADRLGAGGLALVEQKSLDKFQEALAARGLKAEQIDSVDGFNYSRGKPVTIDVFRRAP
ncbi:ArnT family glycosyltransferase [Consotaella salsifontis]|uniref:4-amino-4-deoxy-L-arabinose transferase n=1 Tax=Consotaella salsifontis TaxID=1365950 RepID=A0A1T4P4R5_9HYPH|nr:glycosyltransferase family 39 protein [Consotaella salsifontis]SJZ85918.1 4-amino-4-deoxy-L-arabinose transferase [Consotaella salsifontis]